MDDARFLNELRRYWDEVARGGPATPGELDPELASTIRRLHALPDAPPPDPAYTKRLRENLMQTATMPVFPPLDFPANGRLPTRRQQGQAPALPWAQEWPRRTLAQALIAMLLVMSVAAGFFVFVNRSERRAATPLIATPEPEASPATDWPMYRGNPARSGAMAGPAPDGMPVTIWSFQAEGSAARSPAVAGGVAYLQAGDGLVYALDALTGAERWRADVGGVEDTPTIDGETVYVNTGEGELVALEAATGAERWRFTEPVAGFSAPLVVDGSLYMGSDEGNVYAIDAASGEEQWRASVGGGTSRSMAVADGVVYVPTVTSSLVALNATSGETLWQITSDVPDQFMGTPAIANGAVYVAHTDQLHALDPVTGEERWSADFIGVPVSATETMIVGGDFDGVVHAFAADTGEERWTYATGDRIQAAPAVVGDTVYVASYDRTLYALDIATGAERWGFELDGVADYGPSIANGVIYVGTDAGTLYALGGSGMEQVSAPLVDQATPTPATPVSDTAPESSGELAATFLWSLDTLPGEDLALSPNVSLDPDGNLWVADGTSNTFRIFSPDGRFVERWGEAGDGDGQFNFYRDTYNAIGTVAFRPDGGFYVADSNNFRIQQFDADRKFVRAWGGFGDEDGQFQEPIDVDVAPDGSVFVIDDVRDNVQKFTADGEFLLAFGGPGAEEGQLTYTGFGAINADGNVWVADYGNNRLQQFAPDGTFMRVVGGPGSGAGELAEPQAVAFDSAGRIFVGDSGHDRVAVFAPDGRFLAETHGVDIGGNEIKWPVSMAIDDQDGLYVHDYDTFKSPVQIQKFQLDPAQVVEPMAVVSPEADSAATANTP